MTAEAPSMFEPTAAIDPEAADARPAAAEDLRLARLHLRLGMLTAARAELEDLARRDVLDSAGLAALAEVRWRGGDLEAAAEAADAHLRNGGMEVVAIVVAAEAAAAAGHPTEARELVDRAGRLDAATIDALFAGLPRRAYWPAAAGSGAAEEAMGPEATAAGPTSGRVRAAAGGASASPSAQAAPSGAGLQRSSDAASGGPSRDGSAATRISGTGSVIPGPRDVLVANAGLWDAGADTGDPGAGSRGPMPPHPATPPTWVEPAREKGHADPEAELETARDELTDAPDRGLLRMALVLRLDPTLAPDVLEAVRLRREPAALVIRGDAQRLLGRHLEAEAEFADAAEAIERDAIARARRAGHHATREDS